MLNNGHKGIDIYFRGQSNTVVAENRTNRFEPQMKQIGLRKKVYEMLVQPLHIKTKIGCAEFLYHQDPSHCHEDEAIIVHN